MSQSEHSGKLAPATPSYILRGHASAIHALHFYSNNSRLVSGDAEGWIVIWSMMTKRPVAVWKAHEGAVLGAQGVEFTQGERGKDCRIFTYDFVFLVSSNCFSSLFFLGGGKQIGNSLRSIWLFFWNIWKRTSCCIYHGTDVTFSWST